MSSDLADRTSTAVARGDSRAAEPHAFSVPASTFTSGFDRCSFPFAHSLSSHPLFELGHLVDVVRALEHTPLVTYRGGEGEVGGGWAGLDRRPKQIESVLDALSAIQSAGAWVKIKQLQSQRSYAEFFDSLIDEMEDLLGEPLRERITRSSSTVFISSPGAVTPYHMDHETNFLFQIRGTKTVFLFDGRDMDILSPQDLEQFYATGRERFRDDVQPKAEVHELAPGRGVHQPSCWPHWVKTGPEPSISLSVNFCLRERDLLARVHQCNHYLRRLGARPTPPGRSPLRDGVKKLAFASRRRRRPAENMDEHLRAHLRRIERPLGVLRWVRGHRS